MKQKLPTPVIQFLQGLIHDADSDWFKENDMSGAIAEGIKCNAERAHELLMKYEGRAPSLNLEGGN